MTMRKNSASSEADGDGSALEVTDRLGGEDGERVERG